jgi:hypothetical protein
VSAGRKPAQIFVEGSAPTTGSPYRIFAAVHLESPDLIRDRLDELRRELAGDRFRSRLASIRALRQRSFHFAEDHDSTRDEVLRTLGAARFKSDLCFAIADTRVPGTSYRLLLYDLAIKAKVRSRVGDVAMIVGAKDIFGQNDLDELSESIASSRAFRARPKIAAVTLTLAGPEESCLVAPDYVVGVVRDAMACGTGAMDEGAARRARARFAMLALRFRHVSDVGRGVSYAGTAFAREIQRLGLRN